MNIYNDNTKPTHCKYKVIKNGDDEKREITEYSIIDLMLCSNDLESMIKMCNIIFMNIYNNSNFYIWLVQ